MKLIIRRDQKAMTGLLGGHKGMTFLLTTRIELTPIELELVDRYKVEDYPLTLRTDREGRKIVDLTPRRLTQGETVEIPDVTVLLDNEEVIKEACKNFRVLLDVMATFGGEEVLEF